MEVELKLFKIDDNKEFRLLQNLTMAEAYLDQFMQLRNQLVIAAEHFAREDNLRPVVIQTLSEEVDEQLELDQKVVDVVHRANRKTCVTLLRYSVDQPESSYAQVHFYASKKVYDKFQEIVYLKNKLEEIIYLLDVMNCVYDKHSANKRICNVL